MNHLQRQSASFYIPMPDGEKLAIDIWLPEVPYSEKLSVIVEFTRYWRLRSDVFSKDVIDAFCDRGFAYACVDVRGTGASTGSRCAEIGVQEVADFSPVIEWLVDQSWSNGAVITHGISYVGNTAEIATYNAPDALKATIPQFTDFDLYAMLLFPGGLANIGFLAPWSSGVYRMDLNTTTQDIPSWGEFAGITVKPVEQGDSLDAAVACHQKNIPVTEQLEPITCRDDFEADELNLKHNRPENWVSPYQLLNNPCWQSIPSLHWGSFADAGTAAGVIARFMASKAPICGIIGYWSHGLNHDANPYTPPSENVSPNFEEFIQIKARFLQPLRTPDLDDKRRAPLLAERMLYYFTAGENHWKQTAVWPPIGSSMQRWYLAEQNQLTKTPPTNEVSRDIYPVNFEAGTGPNGRWLQMGAIDYGDRSEADQKLLTYTSKPIPQTIEITGHPLVELFMSSSTDDGAVIIYLETVDPEGRVTLLTEGNLRLMHRKVSDQIPPYPQFGPYHSYKRQDQAPMDPKAIEKVSIVLLPLSVTVKQGDALRIAIAGHDCDSFKQVPEQSDPVYHVYHQQTHLSCVDLSIMDQEKARLSTIKAGLQAIPFQEQVN